MNVNVDHVFPHDQDYLQVMLDTFQQLPDHQTFLKTVHSGSVFWVHDNPVLAEVLAAMAVLSLILLLLYIYKRRQRKAKHPPPLSRHPQVQSSESLRDMQVCRTTRDRASTFDFFGMHHRARNRSQSMSSLIGPPNAPIQSSNSGRKDSLTADLEGLELTLKREEALALCGTGAYYQDQGYLYDEFGIVNLSFQVEYLGVRQTQLKYSTWTPPTPWTEASRRILPQDIMLKLQRDILLDVTKSTVAIKEPTSSGKWDFESPLEEFSTHVLPPVEGGVINLYFKGSSKEEWMEYTFETARMAAQFQLDLLASQVFGKTLHHMFQVLTLVYEGSMAYKGQEFALHDDYKVMEEEKADDKEENHPPVAAASGVAWDDAMRSMSSIPSVRIALERLWLQYRDDRHGSNPKRRAAPPQDAPTESQISLSDEYVKKRLLLGPVDFFRLFVPVLPETSVPQNEAGKARMEQLLRWRKRTARAAVLVRAYTLSHRVVNQGWKLPFPIPPTICPLTRRLAYDGNEDNNRRDVSAKNEYYEATVSRDIMCPVRPYDYFSDNGNEWGQFFSKRKSVLSPCQAYSLVGMHVFKLPNDKAGHPLNPMRDPIASIPSLGELISSHPEVDFIIGAHYPASRPVVVVTCHCRSLAKGVDPQFDTVMDRFTNGTKETRDRKLHLMLQLGPYQHGLSFFGWLILRILSILLSLTRKGRESSVGLESSKERSPFPAIRLMNFSQLRHFGGALQTDPSLPKNYVSMNVNFHNKHMPNIISRILFHRLDKGSVEKNIMDFTFVLEGEQEDELPERALCTQRIVHVETQKVALPVSFSSARLGETKDESDQESIHSAVQILQDFVSVIGSPFRGQQASEDSSSAESDLGESSHALNYVESDDPFEMAANEITDLLAGAIVPVRKDQLQLAKASKRPSSRANALQHEASVPVPVLKLLTRSDMKRFYKAADCDLKTAAVRLVKTTAWRGQTFPIDKRKCRIELQNGQFFQHGRDRQGNLIFYFRNTCLGPWRKDEDAVIYAVLHRLDECLQDFSKDDPDVKCTLILLMGRPYGERKKKQGRILEIVQESDRDEVDEEDHDDEASLCDVSEDQPNNFVSNPRIARDESWWPHTNKKVIHRLIKLLEEHYPERLAKAFLVRGHGSNPYYATKIRGRIIATALLYPETRTKVKFITKLAELKNHVEASELLTIVGGTATIHKSVYEC